MSKRKQIRNKFIEILETITTTGGSSVDIGMVQKRFLAPDEVPEDKFPAAFVFDTDERKIDMDADELKCELDIVITGYIKEHEDYSGDDTEDALDDFLEDIEKAITADRFIGLKTFVTNTLPLNIKSDFLTLKPYAIFDFKFRVTYYQEYGTP